METKVNHSTGRFPCYAQGALLGSASGTQGNYCAVFPQSAYYTKSFQNIWQFSFTPDGQSKRAAYCIQKGKTGPVHGDRRYRSVDVAHALPDTTATQRIQLAWLLQHVYPAISVAEQFNEASVNASSTPTLDENDAYAAAQIAIWSVFDPPDPANPDGWRFFACGTETIHPKSERLEQTVASLYRRSLEAAQEIMQPLPCDGSGCRVASIPGIACLEVCGDQAMMQGPNGWLFGPLRVYARQPFTLSIKASCAEEAPSAPPVLVDEAYAPISAPSSGQRFYISFPQNVWANCYHLTLRTVPSDVCAVVMQDMEEPDRMQMLGITAESKGKGEATTVCFCSYAPIACPECPVCPEPPTKRPAFKKRSHYFARICPPCEEQCRRPTYSVSNCKPQKPCSGKLKR
ncbi:MAG: thioester domain-containing protein [Clostridia bacterium]|nr:thioester domain-containing protein [Clostridia bacterium]